MRVEPSPALRELWDADARAGIDPFEELKRLTPAVPLELAPAPREDLEARPARATPRLNKVRAWRQTGTS